MVTRRTATVTITLDARNDEAAQYAVLLADERKLGLEQARAKPEKRGSITRKLNALRKQMEAVKASIDTGKVTLTVTALAEGKYRNLLKDHPPVEGDEESQKHGYNMDTFLRPFLEAATVRATNSDGEDVPLDLGVWLDDEDGLDSLDTLTWFNTALGLQTGRVNRVPQLRAS